jgi:hypothetical protein
MPVADGTFPYILWVFRKLWKMTVSFVISVCLTPAALIFMKFYFGQFQKQICLEGWGLVKIWTKIAGILHEDLHIYWLLWLLMILWYCVMVSDVSSMVTKITSVHCLLWLHECTWSVVVCVTCTADWYSQFCNVCVYKCARTHVCDCVTVVWLGACSQPVPIKWTQSAILVCI